MSVYFFYKDGQGKIFDEEGKDAMDWEEDVSPFHLETSTNFTQYEKAPEADKALISEDLDERMKDLSKKVDNTAPKLPHKTYSNNQKVFFLYYLKIKLFKAAKAGRVAHVNERTAQDWAKKLRDDPEWDMFEKKIATKGEGARKLQEKHKEHLIRFYDECPTSRVSDAVQSLTEAFEDFSLKETSVRNFLKKDYNVSMKKVTLRPVARNEEEWLKKRFDRVQEWSKTDMDFLRNCVFIDESGFNINMRTSYVGLLEELQP